MKFEDLLAIGLIGLGALGFLSRTIAKPKEEEKEFIAETMPTQIIPLLEKEKEELRAIEEERGLPEGFYSVPETEVTIIAESYPDLDRWINKYWEEREISKARGYQFLPVAFWEGEADQAERIVYFENKLNEAGIPYSVEHDFGDVRFKLWY